MRLPNFMIVGVEKAGTTSVYNYLKQHPQVYMSPVKEPNFLERDWSQYYAQGGKYSAKRIDTLEKYATLFEGVTNEVAIGEVSPNCLFHYEKSIPRIQEYLPDAQIIVILRSPVDRAYSDYLMHVRDCINSDSLMPLSEQIKFSSQNSFTILKGFYYEKVKYFQDTFGADRFSVLLYDDLKQSNRTFMKEIYEMIGVSEDFNPDTSKRFQTAEVPKNKSINSLLRTKNPVRSAAASCLKVVMPAEARQKLRNTLIGFNAVTDSLPSLSYEDRAALIEIYKEDILRLQDLLNRDLTAWLS
jgi:hypothetical protein